ncbi:hypothetical protein JXB41_07865 [Candidatus Woesearchaeota archaeon]|nr:hypothetical protein [Candidatus Woesearchaeota archaeon]
MNVLLIIFTILGGISKFYKRFIPISLGLELKTFFTIVIAYAIDPYTALLCAIFMILIAAVVANRYCYWVLIKIGVYSIVCLMMAMFKGAGIVAAGRMAVLALNILYILFNALLKDFRILSDLPGNAINIVFNFLLLSWFGETLAGVLS